MIVKHGIVTYAEIPALHLGEFGSTVVLTAGVFDALHIGHLEHLEFCKRHGHVLVVCVGTDDTVRMLKGPGRPIIGQAHRARMVAALECVDAVVISEESGRLNFTRLMQILKPDRLVVTADDPARASKFALCERMGVEMRVDDTRPVAGPSTTRIVTQILEIAR